MYYRIGFLCLLVLAVIAAPGDVVIASPLGSAIATPSIHMAAFGPLGADPESTAQRFEGYIGHQFEAPLMQLVRSEHAKSLVLLYEIAGAANDSAWAKDYPNDPVGYYWISANHPEWFLLDKRQAIIRFHDYPAVVAVDPGNPDYQKAWASKAIERLTAIGADGIMIDNANSRYDWNFTTLPKNYSSQYSYGVAMDSFIRYVSQQIQAAGFLVLGNGSGEPWNAGLWSSWIGMLDGRASQGSGLWNETLWLAYLASYQRWPDKIYFHFLPDMKLHPEQTSFAIASFLLWQGPNSYLGVDYCTAATLPYDPLMGIQLGEPTGPCTRIADVTYRRIYEHGEVYVNGSATRLTSIRVSGGGKDVNGKVVASGTRNLRPHTWLIVIR